jgi:DNA replication protein DnaC
MPVWKTSTSAGPEASTAPRSCAWPRPAGSPSTKTCSFGATGCGKTYLACALAQAAIRHGRKALYWRTPRLLDELRLAHADGRAAQLLTSWAHIDVLVLDDLGLRPLTTAQAADLLEVIEDRHQRRSTIITSQLPIHTWHDNLGDPTLADAICDRILHTAYRIELHGESLRKTPSINSDPPTQRP